jgi:neutral ceramidase
MMGSRWIADAQRILPTPPLMSFPCAGHVSFRGLMVAFLLSVPAFAAPAPGASARVFRAGAATSNITPPLGAGIVGNFDIPPATHIHDELHARCLALDDGTTKLVFVVVDNVSINREVYDEAKRRIHAATGVPTAHLMMSATHTHSATSARGSNAMVMRGPGDAAALTLDDYQSFLVQRITDGVRRALHNLEPARIGWGSGQVPQHVFNRRWKLKDGKTVVNPFGEQDRAIMNPGMGRTDLAGPAGPVNPEVYFVSVESTSGRPIALLANYWLHYVGGVPNGHISADYFGVFCDRIQELLGADRQNPPFVGLLANGPCGDVNNINFGATSPAPRLPPYEKIKLVANDVAQEVLRVRRTLRHQDWVELKAAQSELDLQTRRPGPELIARAKQVLARPATVSPIHRHEKACAERTLTAAGWPDSLRIVLQTFRIGELAVAAIPFETFTETGLAIKAASPFKDTFTIELANGGYGYLPTPEQHELGGYETWLGTNRVEKDASRKIEAEIKALLAKVRE